jgi:hypothetical protein
LRRWKTERRGFQTYAGESASARFVHEEPKKFRRGGYAESFRTDVRDTVSIGVRAAGAGSPGEIDAHAVGGTQTGAFADEDYRESGAEGAADLVADRYATLLADDDWGQFPAFEAGDDSVDQGSGAMFDGAGREAVTCDEDCVIRRFDRT